MASFAPAYNLTMNFEGGYANVSGDKGGETYKGISRKANPNWNGWPIVDANKPLKHGGIIKSDKLEKLHSDFYLKNYWDKYGLSKIDSQKLANMIFDFGVLSGQAGIALVTKVVNALTGSKFAKWSSEVVSKLNGIGASKIIPALITARAKFFEALVAKDSTQSKFLKGWLNRLSSFTDNAAQFLQEHKTAVTAGGAGLLLIGAGVTLYYLYGR